MPQPLDTLLQGFMDAWIEVTGDDEKHAREDLENLLASQKQELIKRFEKAFKEKYQGAGEIFFPYESDGNCTKEEEEQYIYQEWLDLRSKLQELKEST